MAIRVDYEVRITSSDCTEEEADIIADMIETLLEDLLGKRLEGKVSKEAVEFGIIACETSDYDV